MLRLGARVLDTRFRPAVLIPVAAADRVSVRGAVEAGADVVELPASSTTSAVADAAVAGPVAVSVAPADDVAGLAGAGAALLLVEAEEEARHLLPAGSGTVVLGRDRVADLVDVSLAELCARIAAAPGTGCPVVRTTEPVSARRAADLVEALEREAAGVFP